MIAVIDYGVGNLFSLCRSLEAVGQTPVVTGDPAVLRRADKLFLPGVGAFADAAEKLRRTGLDRVIREEAAQGKPILGICLGMQVFFDRGNESALPPVPGEERPWTPGLCMMGGDVVRLSGEGVKVPHVGWNAVDLTGYARYCPLFAGVESGTHFYFTHSYVCVPAKEERAVATTEHGTRFASAVWNGGNLFGCQFHPEKSSDAGARIMENFVHIAQGGSL